MRLFVPLSALAVATLLCAGCFHANVDRDAIRVFSEPAVQEPPPSASERERTLYDYCKRLEKKVDEKERKADRLEDENEALKDQVKELKKRIERLEEDLRKARRY